MQEEAKRFEKDNDQPDYYMQQFATNQVEKS